jgi:hypothetical protein
MKMHNSSRKKEASIETQEIIGSQWTYLQLEDDYAF